ncbi:hypothetical protein V6Z11_A10G184300 [Gossypium hirsutum]
MSFAPPPPPIFAGENYHIWIVKMKTYLQALDLWSAVDVEQLPLRANPTIAQIKQHGEERAKKHKAMACLQNGVSDVIFTRIMACDSPCNSYIFCNGNESVDFLIRLFFSLSIFACCFHELMLFVVHCCCCFFLTITPGFYQRMLGKVTPIV